MSVPFRFFFLLSALVGLDLMTSERVGVEWLSYVGSNGASCMRSSNSHHVYAFRAS